MFKTWFAITSFLADFLFVGVFVYSLFDTIPHYQEILLLLIFLKVQGLPRTIKD